MIELFVAGFALALFAGLIWAFKALPAERWQIAASIPLRKNSDGNWTGVNLTFYGMLTALSCTTAAAFLIVMVGAIGIELARLLPVIAATLVIAVPAARWIAFWVERKPCTFTVAGAVFVAVVACPLILATANLMLHAFSLPRMPLLPMLAAISVSYALGEGLGRIACISFGCCYGKPVTSTNGLARKVFTRLNFVFEGTTKKIAYESGMDGVPVVPIQALTATLYVLVALFSFWLFMRARFTEALLIAMGVTQLWRAFSETLRADYRGGGAVSIYQFLALASLPLTIVYTVMFAESGRFAPDLGQGIAELWSPGSLIALQFLGVAIFLYTGRSEVTESQLQIQICRDKI